MSLSSILQDPTSYRIAVLILIAILVLVAYFAHRLRGSGPKVKSTPGPILLNLDKEGPSKPPEAETGSEAPAAPVRPPAAPSFRTLATRTTFFADIMRGLLILLALVVALGFLLLVLPQGAVDRFSHYLESRNTNEPFYEKIAFLYLGDEVREDQFEIRGAVRNITTEPIEQLDAILRLYSTSGELLETAVVRMDKENIAPDEVAQFHLVYPHYDGRFGSYAVEFKLRQGAFVPYKDMRGTR